MRQRLESTVEPKDWHALKIQASVDTAKCNQMPSTPQLFLLILMTGQWLSARMPMWPVEGKDRYGKQVVVFFFCGP